MADFSPSTYAILVKKIASALVGVNSITIGADNKSIDITTNDGQTFNLPIPNPINDPDFVNKLGWNMTEQCLTYDGNDIAGSNTGDVALEQDVSSGLTIGGIAQGEVLPTGLTFTDFVRKLLSATPSAPSVKFVATISDGLGLDAIREKGSPVDIYSISAIVTRGANDIASVTWSGAINATVSNPSVGSATYSQTLMNVSDNTTIKVTVIDASGARCEEEVEIEFVDAIKIYTVADGIDVTNVTEADLIENQVVLKPKEENIVPITLVGEKMSIAYPVDYGELTEITDVVNNINMLGMFEKTTINITTPHGLEPYYVYIALIPSYVTDMDVRYNW